MDTQFVQRTHTIISVNSIKGKADFTLKKTVKKIAILLTVWPNIYKSIGLLSLSKAKQINCSSTSQSL